MDAITIKEYTCNNGVLLTHDGDSSIFFSLGEISLNVTELNERYFFFSPVETYFLAIPGQYFSRAPNVGPKPAEKSQ